jgi:hypothetical protein
MTQYVARHRKPDTLVMGPGRHSEVLRRPATKEPTPGYTRRHGRSGERRKVIALVPLRL